MNRRSILALTALISAALALSLSVLFPASAAVVLEVGSSGSNVAKVQQRLIQFGYLKGEADGRYGEATRDAVILFQKRNGLTVDGRVGASTAAALGVTLSSSSSAAVSATASVSSDQYLLARLVYAEARGESYKGKVAVAAVVLNRVSSASFPNTISGVIYQKGAFESVSNGSINLTPDSDSIRAAREAMNGWDPTGGCLYFYNAHTVSSSSWILSRTVKTVIGSHSFAT
ncbi:MAG: spore cortex-lytic enzyme [Clostridia bacterium]|nr:spore cortex-lytic enzyme [Clostridia bacterium]